MRNNTGRSDPNRRLTYFSRPIGACYIALVVVPNGKRGPQNPRRRMLSLNTEQAQALGGWMSLGLVE